MYPKVWVEAQTFVKKMHYVSKSLGGSPNFVKKCTNLENRYCRCLIFEAMPQFLKTVKVMESHSVALRDFYQYRHLINETSSFSQASTQKKTYLSLRMSFVILF